jgi:putative DNA primase/helicase
MQCPVDFAAVGALVMVAAIVGRKIGIRPMKNNDWTVIPNLWGAVVGNSGIMKSPTLNVVLSPIKKLQALAFEDFNNAKAEYETNAELLRLQKSVDKSKARKALTGDVAALRELGDRLDGRAVQEIEASEDKNITIEIVKFGEDGKD